MHKVLERQLRHLRIATDGQTPPTLEQWNALLARVGAAYTDNDQDRYTLERSIELSSTEMQQLHQRLASERDTLRSIFESAPLGILRLCPRGEILDANPAAIQMLGLTRADLSGKTLTSLFDGEPTRRLDVSGMGTAAVLERRYTRQDGSFAWFQSTKTWVCDPSGATQFGTVVLEDVTAKKHLECSLRHAQKLESVGRLAAGIAHEINTPVQFVNDNVHFLKTAFETMTSLVKVVDALLDEGVGDLAARWKAAEDAADWEYLDQEVPTSIAQTLDGLHRVGTIVQSMKNFAHHDQGEQTLTDLNSVIESTLAVASHELKSVAIATCNFADIPRVLCCRGDLGQVFLNLLVNAAHAISDVATRTGELGVVTVTTRQDGDSVVVSISDTGGGIPEAVRPNLFEPFFTTKEVGRGTGQGLALARSIVVQKHHGTLTYDTKVGVGTTFHVRLPIDGARSAEPAAA